MKTPTPEQDPWDHIVDHDRDPKPQPDPDKFTGGEIAICLVFIVGVLGGISIGAYKIISAWLELP